MNETTEADMLALLEARRHAAANIIELRARDPVLTTEANVRWRALVVEVTEAMKGHPDFSVQKSVYFLSRQILFGPWSQAENLLEQAAQAGSRAALDWYRKVLRVTSADVDVISVIYGLIVREPVNFSNGVRLVPVGDLIDTPQARVLTLRNRATFTADTPLFPSAAVITFRDIAGEVDHVSGYNKFLNSIETIRSTVTALTLSKANTPITGESWIDFHDPDLIATGFGYGWQSATFDGRVPRHPAELDPAAVEWAEKFLLLKDDVAAKCSVALARLNLARRRQTPGDQAIDGCIAVEALLSDPQPGDLTYKLKLRAARLLGNSYTDREQISRKISRFYQLRGKVVHGQSTGGSNEDRQTAKDGLDVALSVLRTIVLQGKIPASQVLELGPIDEA
jgi:hypothetical protein